MHPESVSFSFTETSFVLSTVALGFVGSELQRLFLFSVYPLILHYVNLLSLLLVLRAKLVFSSAPCSFSVQINLFGRKFPSSPCLNIAVSCGWSFATSLSLLHRVHQKAIRQIDNPSLIPTLQLGRCFTISILSISFWSLFFGVWLSSSSYNASPPFSHTDGSSSIPIFCYRLSLLTSDFQSGFKTVENNATFYVSTHLLLTNPELDK